MNLRGMATVQNGCIFWGRDGTGAGQSATAGSGGKSRGKV